MSTTGQNMQGIARHGSGWRYRWTEPVSGKRQLGPTLPLEDAKHFRMWVLAQQRKVTDNDPRILSSEWKYEPLAVSDGTKTWGQQANEWLLQRTAEVRSINVYRFAINRSTPIHNTPVQDLDDDALRAFAASLVKLRKQKNVDGELVDLDESRYSPTTIRHTMSVVRSVIMNAVAKNAILKDPSPGYRPAQAMRRREHRYLTTDEYAALRSCAENDTVRLMFDLMAHAGLRLGELLALRVSRLYLDAKVPYIRIDLTSHSSGGTGLPKGAEGTDRKRNVTIGAELTRDLRAYLDLRGDQGKVDWLFLSPTNPTKYISHNWGGDHGAWRRTVSEAARRGLLSLREGLPTPHDLRHSHASWLLNAGVPLITVSKRLGHKNVIMTASVYAHVMDVLDDQCADVMQKLFGTPG